MSMLIFFGATQETVRSTSVLTADPTVRYHTSPLIAEQAPDFIQADHPKFIAFLEAYFEWMETEGNPGETAFHLRDMGDIDDTLDKFIQHFKFQYLNPFPKDLAIDKATNTPVDEKRLLKRVKEFYRAKGTEKSYQLLMRIIRDTDLGFYYPKEDIIKTSHGKWYEQPIIKTTYSIDMGVTGQSGESGETNIFNTVGNLVYQVKDNEVIANSKVERVQLRYGTDTNSFAEVTMSNISGKYQPGLLIAGVDRITTNVEQIDPLLRKEYIYSLATDIQAITSGRFYDVGDIVNITSKNGVGKGAKAIVTSTGTRGEINEIKMIDHGLNFLADDTVGPFAIYGVDTNYSDIKGWYYPLYTSSLAVDGDFHVHKFTEFPNVEFFMPDGTMNHGKETGSSNPSQFPEFSSTSTQGVSFDVSTFKGQGASFEISVGGQAFYPGIYLNDDGKISSGKKIRDNYFYQEFSYQIRSNITLDKYKQAFLDIVHPAGMKMFGSYLSAYAYGITQNVNINAKSFEISTLGHYTPYSFNTTENLRLNSGGNDLYPFGYNGNSGASASNESGSSPHISAVARTRTNYGETYYSEPSRTGPSGFDAASEDGATFNFDVTVCGGTWDPGTTGPLWYLSKSVESVSGATAVKGANLDYHGHGGFSITADAGDFSNFGSYWVIFAHPNVRGITGIPAGIKFSDVEIDPFLYIERQDVQGSRVDPSTLSVRFTDNDVSGVHAYSVRQTDTYRG